MRFTFSAWRAMRVAGAKARSVPITGHSLFVAEAKPEVEREYEGMTRLEIFALLNDQWAALDKLTKSAYEKRADYARRVESRRRPSGERKASNHPKVSAYSVFVNRFHEILKQTNPEMSVGERSRAIAGLWARTAVADRAPFVNEAKRQTRKLRKVSDDED